MRSRMVSEAQMGPKTLVPGIAVVKLSNDTANES